MPVNKRKRVFTTNKNDQSFLIQRIRTQYTEKEHTALDERRELDASVKRPANFFAYVFGSISAIVMGSGMSLIMTGIGETPGLSDTPAMCVGIPVGIAGILLVSAAYPLYNRVLRKERGKIAPEIIRLTDELMK